MKKILLTLLLLNLFLFPVYGDCFSSDGNYEINLTYTQEPTYSVLIPKEINCTNTITSLPYYVKGDIYADQNLIVRFEKQTYLTYLNTQIAETYDLDPSIVRIAFGVFSCFSGIGIIAYIIAALVMPYDEY